MPDWSTARRWSRSPQRDRQFGFCSVARSAARSTIGDSKPDIPTDVGGNEAVLNNAILIAAGALVATLRDLTGVEASR